MKVLVYYVDYHWDNYQGDSGKSFEMRKSIEIPETLEASNILFYINAEISKRIKDERPFQQNSTFSIQKMEIV